MGRPPIQHHKHVHVIALSPETEEAINDLKNAYLGGKVSRSIGHALQGLFSGDYAIPAILAAIGTYLAYMGIKQAVDTGAFQTAALSPMRATFMAVGGISGIDPAILNDIWNQFWAGQNQGSTGAPIIARPTTPEEAAVQEEKIRREGEIGL